MRYMLLLASLVTLLTFKASAQEEISIRDVGRYIGKAITLNGTVSGVKIINKRLCYLYLKDNSSVDTLTVLYNGRGQDLIGKAVTVSGKVINFKGKPSVNITKRGTLTVNVYMF
jgi:hypothetical protein